MAEMNPEIAGVTITQGEFQEIQYDYNPVIKDDDAGTNGVCRFLDLKIVDGKVKFDEEFVFSVYDVSETEKNELLALGGRNDVEITLKGATYKCSCSTFAYEADEQGQILDSVELTLKVIELV